MYCPQCRSEYREEITVCKECGVALVAALEPETAEIEDLDIAVTVTDEETAYIIRGYLESEGIPCQIENVTFHAAPSEGLTRVRLWTKKVDVSRVRRLLDEHEDYNLCSHCGHIADPKDRFCDFCGEKFEN
jgi:predicted amidophosphoribosyltransferase